MVGKFKRDTTVLIKGCCVWLRYGDFQVEQLWHKHHAHQNTLNIKLPEQKQPKTNTKTTICTWLPWIYQTNLKTTFYMLHPVLLQMFISLANQPHRNPSISAPRSCCEDQWIHQFVGSLAVKKGDGKIYKIYGYDSTVWHINHISTEC